MATANGSEQQVTALDVTIPLDNAQSAVAGVIALVKPHWNIHQVKFKVFTEGISNQLVGCFNDEDPPGVLVRIYGAGTELFIDRAAEQRTMHTLAIAGQGPALLATFNNGLVYEFVQGSVVTSESVATEGVWPLVAYRLAALHRLPPASADGRPQLWRALDNFLKLIPDRVFHDPKYSSLSALVENKKALQEEINWLRKNLEGRSSAVVFCHNDLLLANIIVHPSEDAVTFIDYEYAADNYQAFDIANHFNEFAGVGEHMNWLNIPAEEFMRRWVRAYLAAYTPELVSDDSVEALLRDVQRHLPSSHLHWAVWAVVQSLHSQIEFDFIQYAVTKFEYYFKVKHLVELP